MKAKRKPIIIFVVIILLFGHLLGDIKAVGKLLIPTSKGEKQYCAVITFTRAEINIECKEKIFQPFNEFDVTKQAKLVVNTADVEEIQIQSQNNKIFIITKDSFWKKYRNISIQVYKSTYIGFLSWTDIQKWALIFVVNNPAVIGTVEELKKVIGKQCLVTKG